MSNLILLVSVGAALVVCSSSTLLVAGGTTAAAGLTAATVGVTLSSATASTIAGAALTAAGIGTAAAVGALAASAIIKNKRRYKREIGDASSSCFGLDNPELMYILAANSDQLGCGQRLVCELEATPDAELNETEQQILQLFGRDVRPLKASQMLNPKSAYHYAAQVGVKAASPLECAEVFDLCPLDRSAIMKTYEQFATAANEHQ